MKKFTIATFPVCFALLFTFVFVSCGEDKTPPPPPQDITVVNVLQKDVPIYQEFVGQVYGHADIPIRARVTGFLHGIHFEEGSTVTKGQLLYTIDPEPLKAQVAATESQLAEAKTQLAKALSDLNRIKPLADINAVSKSDLVAAQAEYDASQAYVDAMRSNLEFTKIQLGYCWMKSPLNGTIGKTQARIGEFVGQEPNPVILNTVSTTDSVRVEFFLSEGDYIRLAREVMNTPQETREASRDEGTLQLILADGSLFDHKGNVNFINREVDPQTGAILIEASFPNPDRLLRPGQYAKVVVKLKNAKDALIIPQRCLSELQGQYSVFVIGENNTIAAQQVTLGSRIGDMQIIKSGLDVDDLVVIDAIQKVGTGMVVNPQVVEFESKSETKY